MVWILYLVTILTILSKGIMNEINTSELIRYNSYIVELQYSKCKGVVNITYKYNNCNKWITLIQFYEV